jgi:uncharacterized protein
MAWPNMAAQPVHQSRRRAVVAALIILTVAAAATWWAVDRGTQSTLQLVTPGGRLVVDVARTPERRARGLSKRASSTHDGLLLVWDAPGKHPIWMADMQFALDLVWLDGDGHVLGVIADVPPCERQPCPLYALPGTDGSTSVLEVPADTARRHGITVGSIVRVIENNSVRP